MLKFTRDYNLTGYGLTLEFTEGQKIEESQLEPDVVANLLSMGILVNPDAPKKAEKPPVAKKK